MNTEVSFMVQVVIYLSPNAFGKMTHANKKQALLPTDHAARLASGFEYRGSQKAPASIA